jgi:hypothetical protein
MGHVPMDTTETWLCVNFEDPVFWKSTPILYLPPWPDEDLSLLDSETYSDSPPVSKVVWLIHPWRHVGYTVIGILPHEPPVTLHGIGEGREREHPTSGKLWDLPTNTNLSLGRWKSSTSRWKKVTSADLNRVSKKEHHQEEGRLKI